MSVPPGSFLGGKRYVKGSTSPYGDRFLHISCLGISSIFSDPQDAWAPGCIRFIRISETGLLCVSVRWHSSVNIVKVSSHAHYFTGLFNELNSLLSATKCCLKLMAMYGKLCRCSLLPFDMEQCALLSYSPLILSIQTLDSPATSDFLEASGCTVAFRYCSSAMFLFTKSFSPLENILSMPILWDCP